MKLSKILLGVAMFAADAKLVHLKSMPESKIVSKPLVEYPPDAAQLSVRGTVRINIIIGLDGHVESARLVSGHPLLSPAALQNARHWVFEPTLVDEKPVRVATEIQVAFGTEFGSHPIDRHAPKPNPGPESRP
jgi:TonB family protein